MPALKPITIFGGGLAGLTLGIGLRQKGIPATVWEASSYPRHRVCGEFISGQGIDVLERLDLLKPILQAGGRRANSAIFFNVETASSEHALPRAAVCLSRFKLDALLAESFRKRGGELRERQRWREAELCEGTVRATGRRLQPVDRGWRWFGLKAHARNIRLAADLEMHLADDSYVGLCCLEDDVVNVCGLFRRRVEASDAAQGWEQRLRGPASSALFHRLEAAIFLPDTFCSVAGLSFRRCLSEHVEEVCIGDALTMIPPVTGNGMSMAFESAESAVVPLVAFSRGEISWCEARQAIGMVSDRTFARRLVWAKLLQRCLFNRLARAMLFPAVAHWRGLWQFFFWQTR